MKDQLVSVLLASKVRFVSECVVAEKESERSFTRSRTQSQFLPPGRYLNCLEGPRFIESFNLSWNSSQCTGIITNKRLGIAD